MLLSDIEDRFGLGFAQNDRRKTQPKEIQEDVLERFEPYFLNTYLTQATLTNTSIVDGQQRLTTLLLILIKLYRILTTVAKDPLTKGKTFSIETIRQLIFETNDFGEVGRFKIFNKNREEAFRALIQDPKDQNFEPRDETQRRMKENFELISVYFDSFLAAGQTGPYDLAKTTYYIAYLLDRISIVEIRIERQDNVAMIFEVVNDRGLGLKPYEILKGKLIGTLPGPQKEEANRLWMELQEKYFAAVLNNTTEKSIDLDSFFRAFFRAKFADSEADYERFEGDYHHEIYRDPKIRAFFGDFQDRSLLFERIVRDLYYFADLYCRLRTSYEYEYLIYNKLLDQNQQYLLLLSNIRLNDPDEKAKITAVTRKFDQLHVILRLLDAYDSPDFQRLIYPVNAAIREKDTVMASAEFDKALIKALEEADKIAAGQYKKPRELFDYERFKDVPNKWMNFSKYVLMRIDRYLAELLGRPSFASDSLSELENRFNRYSTKRYGMHLEHIYTQHPANRALFVKNGVLDETSFQQTRNLLGMVLLLKDKHNLSSNDDIYKDKVDTYRKSGLVWNELLVGHVPGVDVRNLPDGLLSPKIDATPEGVFPREKVQDRQKALFKVIEVIWGMD
jgi:uncharacterized protein with ParB-like and HNH nuclease domain